MIGQARSQRFVGKSKFREMVPALRSMITGERPDHNSVRGAVEQMLNEGAIQVAEVAECEPSEVEEADVRAHAVRTLLHEGAVRTTREMRRRVRPTPVPHVQMATIQTGDSAYYGLLKFDTQEQLDLVLRILNNHIDNLRLDGRSMNSERRQLFSSFFGGGR